MAPLHLRYFAWLKDRLGCSDERVALPPDVEDVGALRAWMRTRGSHYDDAFAAPGRVRAAVNLEFADDATPVAAGDEVAFFPPVTGG